MARRRPPPAEAVRHGLVLRQHVRPGQHDARAASACPRNEGIGRRALHARHAEALVGLNAVSRSSSCTSSRALPTMENARLRRGEQSRERRLIGNLRVLVHGDGIDRIAAVGRGTASACA